MVYAFSIVWNLNYESINELKAELDRNGLAMTKRFGQNFLLSEAIRDRIVDQMGDISGKTVWEVGPGLGAITSVMIRRNANLTSFEIDHGFAEILRTRAFGDEENFRLIEGDALKTLFETDECPDVICGNLPYNVGSVIIASLIEKGKLPETMVFTLQKEVVERMTSKVGDEEYSSFSILTQFDYETKYAFTIGRKNFYPEPNVESAVVVMKRKAQSPLEGEDRDRFLSMMRALFAQRRKTVRNNLAARLGKERTARVIEYAGLQGNERAEALPFETLLKLAEGEKNCL